MFLNRDTTTRLRSHLCPRNLSSNILVAFLCVLHSFSPHSPSNWYQSTFETLFCHRRCSFWTAFHHDRCSPIDCATAAGTDRFVSRLPLASCAYLFAMCSVYSHHLVWWRQLRSHQRLHSRLDSCYSASKLLLVLSICWIGSFHKQIADWS